MSSTPTPDRRAMPTNHNADAAPDQVSAPNQAHSDGGGKLPRIGAALSPYFVVFCASACGLIIEIVASRILAPTIGVSLFTWTSIIGVVLAGISIGNYVGGIVADKRPARSTLGVILMAASVASIAVLPMVDFVSSLYDALSIVPRILLITSTLFLLPSVILGMVTPVVIKLRLSDLSQTGNVVGKIYAVSTAGSIFGVFITGFVLIQWIGTRPILLGVAAFLALMALSFGGLWRLRIATAALLMAFIGITALGIARDALATECQRESNYFCIKIREREIQGRTVRTLTLDQLVHSYVDLDDPTFLVYSYEKIFADIAVFAAERNPRLNALFIGGGGYTMPRFLEHEYPQSRLEVIEIDPAVTQAARDYLDLPADTRIITHNRDARIVVPELPRGAYDVVVGDAFNDVSVPYHLTTLEFNEQVKALLADDGVYMVNVVDKLNSGLFLRAFARTLQASFPYVYLLRDSYLWEDDDRYTFVLAASALPLTAADIHFASHAAGRGDPEAVFMPAREFRVWQDARPAVLLTDDFVPVDNLLLPVYLDSR